MVTPFETKQSPFDLITEEGATKMGRRQHVRSNSANGRVGRLAQSNSPIWRVGQLARSNPPVWWVGRWCFVVRDPLSRASSNLP
ncbi:hypothetical protein F2Q69_00024481 [Brassica cretica]|uniref:Uncharacterized protein n=1 Tax=Brassica cretica TaxID=69181 RepID=A0A8S9QPX0_BRACR|nr:hypothetical protein F2Q69_00024481 [Brassica cretica]